MKKLDIVHHNIIVLCIIIIVLLTGIFLGVKLSATTRGTDGMMIMLFSLCFLITVLQLLVFTQLVHLKDTVENINTKDADKITKIIATKKK
jgi:uncharacterized membrane protein